MSIFEVEFSASERRIRRKLNQEGALQIMDDLTADLASAYVIEDEREASENNSYNMLNCKCEHCKRKLKEALSFQREVQEPLNKHLWEERFMKF